MQVLQYKCCNTAVSGRVNLKARLGNVERYCVGQHRTRGSTSIDSGGLLPMSLCTSAMSRLQLSRLAVMTDGRVNFQTA